MWLGRGQGMRHAREDCRRSRTSLPALGYHFLTPLYDTVIALLTREEARGERPLLKQVARRISATSFSTSGLRHRQPLAVMLKRAQPLTPPVYGIDPDPNVLWAAPKIKGARQRQFWFTSCKAMGAEVAEARRLVARQQDRLELGAASSAARPASGEILRNMYDTLKPGGEIHIADLRPAALGAHAPAIPPSAETSTVIGANAAQCRRHRPRTDGGVGLRPRAARIV